MVKAKTIDLSKCLAKIKFDSLALNAEYADEKVGIKSVKRTISLPYLTRDGIIAVPAHKWAYGWLKSIFGKAAVRNTSVRIVGDNRTKAPIGRAVDILDGDPMWKNPESSAPYVLDDILLALPEDKVDRFPYLEWVISTKGDSRTKLYYMVDGYKHIEDVVKRNAAKTLDAKADDTSGKNCRTDEIMLEIVTTLPATSVEDAFKKLGRSLGMGPRAACARHGTFFTTSFKVTSLGAVSV